MIKQKRIALYKYFPFLASEHFFTVDFLIPAVAAGVSDEFGLNKRSLSLFDYT